jgi:hypothetical protein
MTKHPFPDADLARAMGVTVDAWQTMNPVARVEALKHSSAVPGNVGPEILQIAPARGTVERFTPREVVQTEAGNFRTVRTGMFDAIRRGDAFDVMEQQAARRAKSRSRAHEPLFTVAQILAGREYGALAERHSAKGARCSSLDTSHRGSSGGSYMDAVVAEGRRLDKMEAAIGTGWAMEPRRASPHGDARRAIRVRKVVDLVCIEGKTLSQVLDRFGWSRKTTHLAELRGHLCAALDRLHGL